MTTPLNNGSSFLPTAGEGTVPLWSGTYAATVVNNDDPLGVGRIQMNIPQVLGNSVSAWAVPLGTYFSIPDNGTTVSCTFIGGDPAQPAWIGPLDLAPIVVAGTTAVTYSATAPANPKVGDIWFQVFNVSGTIFYGPAQIWTFNSGTSTFSWVTSAQSGAGTNPVGIVEPNITGGVVTGAKFIADGSGSEYLGYSGTPASGNLILSISPTAGSDGLGNSWPEGISVFDTPSNYIAIVPGATNFIQMFSGAAFSSDPPSISGSLFNGGTSSEYQLLALVSGQQTGSTGNAAVQLFSDSNNGTANTANGALVITGTQIANWNASQFTVNKTLYVEDNINLGSGNNINFVGSTGSTVLGIEGSQLNVFKPIYLNSGGSAPSVIANTSVLYDDDNNVPRIISAIDSNPMAIGTAMAVYDVGTQSIGTSPTTISGMVLNLGNLSTNFYHVSGYIGYTGGQNADTVSFSFVPSTAVHAKGWHQFGGNAPVIIDGTTATFYTSPTMTTSEALWRFEAFFPYTTAGASMGLVAETSGGTVTINSALMRLEVS